MQQDGEDLDYTLFAGVAHPRVAILPLKLSVSQSSLAGAPKLPPTPTPATCKRSMATWLANQILEEDEDSTETEGEERSDEDSTGGKSGVNSSEAAPLNAQVKRNEIGCSILK